MLPMKDRRSYVEGDLLIEAVEWLALRCIRRWKVLDRTFFHTKKPL